MAQHEVLSPLPGIFYRRPAPEKLPTSRTAIASPRRRHRPGRGDEAIHRGPRRRGGKIVRFLIDNEAAVEPGQAVLLIETA
jgi:biotin carboxyl carrier protein